MKLTNEEKQLFSKIKQKHNLAESWLMNIFKKRLKKGLINDPSIKQALTKADKELDDLKNHIKKMKKSGQKIPKWLNDFS